MKLKKYSDILPKRKKISINKEKRFFFTNFKLYLTKTIQLQ